MLWDSKKKHTFLKQITNCKVFFYDLLMRVVKKWSFFVIFGKTFTIGQRAICHNFFLLTITAHDHFFYKSII